MWITCLIAPFIYSSPKISRCSRVLKDYNIAEESPKLAPVGGKQIYGPLFRNSFNASRRNTNSGMGIAVILDDQLAE